MSTQIDDVMVAAGSDASPGGLPVRPDPAIVAPQRVIRIGSRLVPVFGPNPRDPRLHLGLVIVSVLTIGTTLLHFRLSIPQIVVTIAVCAVIEAGYLLATTGALRWPASGMQTATSTVLVLRVADTEHGDWWNWSGLQWFIGVAVLGLLTKYLLRTRHGHVFNPSNVALVAAFLVLGAGRIEPLDYWWGPLDWRMVLAYSVIAIGGIVICGRLGFLPMVAACWATLAAGVGLLTLLGQSITTRWSFAPVTGLHLWRTIMLSPETMIFVFFMITDPKTTPHGRMQRIAFGAAVGVTSTLLLAPWSTEFGSKVGLLAGLSVVSLGRAALHATQRARARHGTISPARSHVRSPISWITTGAVVAVLAGAGVAAAGAPNRGSTGPRPASVDTTAALSIDRPIHQPLDMALPAIVIDPDVAALNRQLATQSGAAALVRSLLFNLDVEAQAIERGDAGLLVAVDHGQRLIDMTDSVQATSGHERIVSTYTFDHIHLGVVFPGGFQSGPNAGLSVTGTALDTTLAPDGAVLSTSQRAIVVEFTLRATESGTWLTSGTIPVTTD